MNTFEQMIERGHERVCFHQDAASGLRAIVAIHSTVLGNALGGTRRWHYATEADALYDVLRLSEGMTYKAACANLPMGGGKSIIWLPRANQPNSEAEARAMGRFVDTFGGAYIAAEDVGVNTQFVDWMALETKHVMGGEHVSTGGDPSPFTAQGVFNGMKACLAHLGEPIRFEGLTVALQGFGSVAYHLALILVEHGANIIATDIVESKLEKARNLPRTTVVGVDEILTADCDILAPCALGGVISGSMLPKLRCRIICGAANNILDDPDEDAALLRNAGILYAPDFVVNAGGLIELAGIYLGMTRGELDEKNAQIEHTTAQILAQAETTTSTYAAAVAVARQRIAAGRKEQVHAG
jgi:leucine dehydrogenase